MTEQTQLTQPPNPIAEGFRIAWRQPATILLEILWRWSYGTIALLLVFLAVGMLLAQLKIGDALAAALRAQDSRMLAAIGLSVLLQSRARLLAGLLCLLGFAVALALLWSIFAAIARKIVVGRLARREPLGGKAMLAAQLLRALAALTAVLLLLAAGVGGFYAATSGGRTDLFRFYVVCAFSVPVIVALWLTLNWQLSITAIFGGEGQSFREARRQALQTVRQQRADFAGTAFIFLLLRMVTLLAVLAIGGVTSHMMGTAPQAYAALVMTLALVYFVVSDFLYVARIGAYLALAAAKPLVISQVSGMGASGYRDIG